MFNWLNDKTTESVRRVVSGESQRIGVPCLGMFGIECPHCLRARRLYAERHDDEASSIYKKKFFVCYAFILSEQYEDYSRRVTLFQMPVNVTDKIVRKMHPKAPNSWGDAVDPEKGYTLIIEKTSGSDGRTQYDVDKGKPMSITKLWNKYKEEIMDIHNQAVLSYMLVSNQVQIFQPRFEMKENETIEIRMLPCKNEYKYPIGYLFFHWNVSQLKEDEIAFACKYDIDCIRKKLSESEPEPEDLSNVVGDEEIEI